MAISGPLTVWEVRQATGNDNWGGGYAPLTVSTFSGTDLVVDASLNTKVTSASHNFVAADVGGRIYITAGTNWTPGFYSINSVAANAATLNASPAPTSTTGGTWLLTGQDYSQANAVQVAINNSTITTSITANVITFTGYTATVADVGNVVHMLTGTNVTAGWYQITAFTGSTWTVTGAVNLPTSGTTTNATGNMGGALASLSTSAGLAGAVVASNKAYCTGSFTANTATAITFGAAAVTPSGTTPPTRLIGYGSTRTDGLHATITLSTNTGLTGISLTNRGWIVENIDIDCASLGTSTGMTVGQFTTVRNCKVANFTTLGINVTGSFSLVLNCEVTGGTAAATGGAVKLGLTDSTVRGSFVHDNLCPGVVMPEGSEIDHCLIVNNTGASSDGIQMVDNVLVWNNTIHGNGRDGIRLTGNIWIGNLVLNNLITNNVGVGLNSSGTAVIGASPEFDGNGYFGNGSNRANLDSMAGAFGINPYVNTKDVILSASPYVGPTTGTSANFILNNTVGGGAACRQIGLPKTWPGNTGTTGFLDFGAVQSCSPTGQGIVYAG